MIIDEYKSGSTIIRIEDRDIGTKEENKEIIDILLSLTIKKISEYSKNDLWFYLNYTKFIMVDKIDKRKENFWKKK